MKPAWSRRALAAAVVRWSAALAALCGFSRSARAEHFDIGLIIRTSQGFAESGWDTYPPEGGLNARQGVGARVGEDILIEWRLRSEFPHGIMKDVLTRLLVVRIPKSGDLQLPPASVARELDNSFVADYLPHHTGRGHVTFRPTSPGNYLVRVQSELTLKEHGHDHFGAVDLRVE